MTDKEKPKGKENKEPEHFDYPASEDIYNRSKEMQDVDPEDPTQKKADVEDPQKWNEKYINDDQSGDDLDVPGAELDDENEAIGEEDEENNYYSIGGDNHENLEEPDADPDNATNNL